jgi:hypothetical protein
MKDLKTIVSFSKKLAVIALVTVMIFTACNSPFNDDDTDYTDNPSGVSGKTSEGKDLIVMDTPMLNSHLKSISEDKTLVFNNLPAKYMPVKGDIICSAPSTLAPYGFLYKVKTVSTNCGETLIATDMATIAEAVENA